MIHNDRDSSNKFETSPSLAIAIEEFFKMHIGMSRIILYDLH